MDYTNFTNEYLLMKYGELIDSEDDPHTIYVDVMREEKQVRDEILKRMEEKESYDFAKWVAIEIFDEMWEYNKDAFAELACRKLAKLGIVKANDDKWELIEED